MNRIGGLFIPYQLVGEVRPLGCCWTDSRTHIVWASSAGAAIGLLRRDAGNVYGAIMLDHDLQQQAKTEDDLGLSGTDVARLLVQRVSLDVPVLVHSTNQSQALAVVRQLEKTGFWVEHIPMYNLTREKYLGWLEEAYEMWEESL